MCELVLLATVLNDFVLYRTEVVHDRKIPLACKNQLNQCIMHKNQKYVSPVVQSSECIHLGYFSCILQ